MLFFPICSLTFSLILLHSCVILCIVPTSSISIFRVKITVVCNLKIIYLQSSSHLIDYFSHILLSSYVILCIIQPLIVMPYYQDVLFWDINSFLRRPSKTAQPLIQNCPVSSESVGVLFTAIRKLSNRCLGAMPTPCLSLTLYISLLAASQASPIPYYRSSYTFQFW